jgi:hypothetical protein
VTKEEFISYLENPGLLNNDTVTGLNEIINDYPFFQAARMLYLCNLKNINSYRFENELVKHAPFIPDRKKLFKLLNSPVVSDGEFRLLSYDKEAFNNFFDPDSKPAFSNKYLETTLHYELNSDDALQNKPKKNNEIDLIDKFISENPTISPTRSNETIKETAPAKESDQVDDSLITETLAGIYVKQGLLNEALKAYEKLILKFPEKNTYFASQIEKINKLISKES